jgi:hypothetical protein
MSSASIGVVIYEENKINDRKFKSEIEIGLDIWIEKN